MLECPHITTELLFAWLEVVSGNKIWEEGKTSKGAYKSTNCFHLQKKGKNMYKNLWSLSI